MGVLAASHSFRVQSSHRTALSLLDCARLYIRRYYGARDFLISNYAAVRMIEKDRPPMWHALSDGEEGEQVDAAWRLAVSPAAQGRGVGPEPPGQGAPREAAGLLQPRQASGEVAGEGPDGSPVGATASDHPYRTRRRV